MNQKAIERMYFENSMRQTVEDVINKAKYYENLKKNQEIEWLLFYENQRKYKRGKNRCKFCGVKLNAQKTQD